MIIFTALIIFNFIIDDFNYQSLKLLFLSVAFYLYYKNKTQDKGGTELTTVEATLNQDEMILDYSKIDRRDGMGSRKEVITFSYEKIYGIEYSANLLCIRIVGKPTIQVQFENQKKYPGTKTIANGDDTKIHFLYLDSENAKEFVDELVNLSNLKIDYKEQLTSEPLNNEIS
jgi:hypothetical protein